MPGIAKDVESSPAQDQRDHGHERDRRTRLEKRDEPRNADGGAESHVPGDEQGGDHQLPVTRADRVEHAVEEGDPRDGDGGTPHIALAQLAELAGEGLVQLALSSVHPAQESPQPLWLRLRDQTPR